MCDYVLWFGSKIATFYVAIWFPTFLESSFAPAQELGFQIHTESSDTMQAPMPVGVRVK